MDCNNPAEENNMKKLLALGSLVLVLASCGSKDEPMVINHINMEEFCSSEGLSFEEWETFCLPPKKK